MGNKAMQIKYWWLTSISLVLLAGCGTDPFPKTGFVKVEKPVETAPVPPLFVIDVPEVVSFQEGKTEEFSFQAFVPSPGQAIVSVSNLPKGAIFSEKDLKIEWAPGYEAANDPNDPSVIVREYPVQITLRSNIDSVTTVSRKVTFLVKDSQRSFGIRADESFNFNEGKTYKRNLFVESTDFPKGPFDFSADGLPAGAYIERDAANPTHFILVYAPNYTVASIKDPELEYYGHYKAFPEVKFRALGPRGSATLKAEFRVFDTRQTPRVSAPAKITQAGPVNFTITAEDINHETKPAVKVNPEPKFGALKITPVPNAEEGSTFAAFNIDWDNIPNDKMGTTEKLNFEICVLKDDSIDAKSLCSQFPIEVTFSGTAHPVPIAERATWPVGNNRYVRVGEVITVPISLKDPETGEWASVSVFPENLRNEVTWEKGELIIKTQTVGVKPFSLLAQTRYGVNRVEHFVLDALPASWNPTLLLGDSLTDPELPKVISLFDGVQVANPVLQPLDERMTTLRNTLVITSSTLSKNKSALAQMETAAMGMSQIIILSPLASTFKGALLTELTRLGVKFEGRLENLPAPVPTLESFTVSVDAGATLTKPSEEMRLEGKLTKESKSPQLLSLASNSACKPLLNLEKQSPNAKYLVAIHCDRGQGKSILLSGFEWGDALLSPADVKITEKWMKEIFPKK